jgi:flagellar biosynthesis/type III secretory pathway protein FliH
VIRGPGTVTPIVPGDVLEARAEAERIVEAARELARRLVEEARAEAERVRAEAKQSGLAEARAEIAAALVAAARARDLALAGAEREVQTLALVAAGRIVQEEIALAPERITAIVKNVLERARRARKVELRVHPDDASVLERSDLGLGVTIVPDPAIGRGGCVVQSELGVIDARVEVQLAAMAKILGCDAP